MQTKEVIARVISKIAETARDGEYPYSKHELFKIAIDLVSNVEYDTFRRTLDALTAEYRMFTVGKVGGIRRNPDGGYIVYTSSDASKKIEAVASVDTDAFKIIFLNNDKSMKFEWIVRRSDLASIANSFMDATHRPETTTLTIKQD